ncbi:MAG: endonuclease/exonuclease/phosphatase family protein [Clostridia bacterium]|nr:endonuclease/exonuclease/phosphatase family protein [Clostridia bacterium]
MPKALKVLLKVILCIVLIVVLVVGGYFAYVFLSYSRIDDNLALEPGGTAAATAVSTGTTYTIVTQNIGFGAYSQDFTFFMDGGKESWGRSKEEVTDNVNAAATTVASFHPDFVLFQEVDFDSTRSYHIEQSELIAKKFENYAFTKAVNYHSAFLMYPLTKPHGSSNSEIMTLSKYAITGGVRRSLPISTGVSKLLDLDRCYSKSRVAVAGGKELVLYNVHLSAYGNSDEIRTGQMNMLFGDMKAEYEAGNYCVCGGDFNHDFTGTSTQDLNAGAGTTDFGWAQPFPADLLPDCISRCVNYANATLQPTCRNCDVPYKEGNFTIIVDGFLVTSNVTCERVENHYTSFTYSDHCPVAMQFKLN